MRKIDADALMDYWKKIDNLCKGALHPRIEDVVQSIEDAPTVEEAKKTAISVLEGNGVAQERKYTFGNDEFNLESAYHDCKLVFDGITDDDSFQEADTGLILYYANEIIYALHEALEGKDINVPSIDTISRQDVLGWLLAYHAKAFDLKGRYHPHEVIGWLVADISKDLFADMRGGE